MPTDKPLCCFEDCDRQIYARDLCEKHYRRLMRTGSPEGRLQGPPICTIEGCGRGVDAKGLCHGHYLRLIRTGDVQVEVPLEPRTLENLELWSTTQPKGQRVPDKVEWALEILSLYAPELLADRSGESPPTTCSGD